MKFILILILGVNILFGQTKWNSKKFGYQVEIPKEFKIAEATGV